MLTCAIYYELLFVLTCAFRDCFNSGALVGIFHHMTELSVRRMFGVILPVIIKVRGNEEYNFDLFYQSILILNICILMTLQKYKCLFGI